MVEQVPQQTIESLDLSLSKVFSDFYVVPNYQREYVWENRQVEQLMQDVFDAFSEDGRTDYFIGSMVVCPGLAGTFELIDGQQRMTTAYVFLCVVKDYLHEKYGEHTELLDQQIAAADIDELGNEVHRYRLELQYEDSGDILQQLAEGNRQSIDIQGQTRSIANILNAYDTIGAFISSNLSDAAAIKKFYAYFTRNVKLVRIKTQSVTHALKIFETINDRGVGLDAMDLLKNLLFMNASHKDFEHLRDRWKKLVDTLYKVGEKPLRFLRYFIFARYGVDRLREDEIYSWFSAHAKECGYESAPLEFVDKLVEAAAAYAHFVSGKNQDGSTNRYLQNITLMSRAARQHLILLLAATHLGKEDFVELCRQLENLFFAYVITHENTREFERAFARWAPELMKVQSRSELNRFVAERFTPARRGLSQRFDLAFDELTQDSVPQYRLRYILGKLTQYVDQSAYGSGAPHDDLAAYVGPKVHVEHILPQTPTKQVLDEFDEPQHVDEYIGRLGNLCLVEASINCSLGNQTFAEKRRAYCSSQYLLTKTIATKVKVGTNTKIDHAVAGLGPWTQWTSESVRSRQNQLRGLARRVWDMDSEAMSSEETG